LNGREMDRGGHTVAIGAGAEGRAQLLALAHLPPGRYDISLVAEAADLGRRGELLADVTVPDFARDSLSASGLVLETSPPPAAAPRDALVPVLTGIPSISRTLSATTGATAMLRIFQGGSAPVFPVTVKTTIVDGRDRTVTEQSATIPGAAFGAARRAEHRVALPLTTLAAGPYLLRVEVTRASAPRVMREMRFEVR
jgi:hypothetical protein